MISFITSLLTSRDYPKLVELGSITRVDRMVFYKKKTCNLTPNISDPCVLLCRGPPSSDPKERGKVTIGISTDDNLECIAQNKASRDQLLLIRQAYADHGIEYIVTNPPDQIIGIAITYTPTYITLTQPTQILDLQNLFYPNDTPVPITWTPISPAWRKKQETYLPLLLSTYIDPPLIYYSS